MSSTKSLQPLNRGWRENTHDLFNGKTIRLMFYPTELCCCHSLSQACYEWSSFCIRYRKEDEDNAFGKRGLSCSSCDSKGLHHHLSFFRIVWKKKLPKETASLSCTSPSREARLASFVSIVSPFESGLIKKYTRLSLKNETNIKTRVTKLLQQNILEHVSWESNARRMTAKDSCKEFA